MKGQGKRGRVLRDSWAPSPHPPGNISQAGTRNVPHALQTALPYRRRNMKSENFLFLAALLLPFSLGAQTTQTIAGAQEFLGTVFENGMSLVDVDTGLGPNRVRSEKVEKCEWREEFTGFLGGMKRTWWCGGSSTLDIHQSENWVDVGSFAVSGASANGSCATRIAVSQKSPRERWFKKRVDGEITEFTLTSGTLTGPFEIDWAKLPGTSHSGKTISLVGSSPKLDFTVPSPEMAARVAYAMEFLRINCDRAAATGF